MKFIYLTKSRSFFAVFLVLSLAIEPIHANWGDDFNDNDISDWQDQFTSAGTDPTWEVSDGILISGIGAININYLCRSSDFKYGEVNIDINIESNYRAVDVVIGRNGKDSESMFLHISANNGAPTPNRISLSHRYTTDRDSFNISFFDIDVTGWHTYTIIRDIETMTLLIDGTQAIKGDFGRKVDTSYAQFCLLAWQEGVQFDNLTIVDYKKETGLLFSNQFLKYTLWTMAIVGVLIVGGFSFRYYRKKKD